jgi:hypothetical protein
LERYIQLFRNNDTSSPEFNTHSELNSNNGVTGQEAIEQQQLHRVYVDFMKLMQHSPEHVLKARTPVDLQALLHVGYLNQSFRNLLDTQLFLVEAMSFTHSLCLAQHQQFFLNSYIQKDLQHHLLKPTYVVEGPELLDQPSVREYLQPKR